MTRDIEHKNVIKVIEGLYSKARKNPFPEFIKNIMSKAKAEK